MWKRAVRGMMDGMSSLFDLYTDVLTNIQSGWTTTIETFLNEGGKFKDFMEGMFLDVLRAFNHMVAEMVARRLMYQVFGNWMGAISEPSFIPGTSTVGQSVEESGMDFMRGGLGQFGGAQKVAINNNIINNTGTEIRANKSVPQFNGREWVINTVLEAYDTDPSVRSRLGGG
jgi:hypothetical protein